MRFSLLDRLYPFLSLNLFESDQGLAILSFSCKRSPDKFSAVRYSFLLAGLQGSPLSQKKLNIKDGREEVLPDR